MLQYILIYLAHKTLRRYKPMIIGITGSAGKTSTREAIFSVLKKRFRMRASKQHDDYAMAIILAILEISDYGGRMDKWVFAVFRIWWQLVFQKKEYPEILILEYGVERPGDMDYLLSIARPAIAVVTAVGDIPMHVEFFKNPEDVIREKAKLAQVLSVNNYAILNHDDYAVYDMKGLTKAHVITFGFEAAAELAITNVELRTAKDEKLGDIPEGIAFKVVSAGSVVPIRLHGGFGKGAVYSAAAAAAVGLVLNMNLVEVAEALAGYVALAGRLRLLKGIKNSFIIDDTYGASPDSMRAALDTLKSLPGRRKIAVLGGITEVGRYAEQVHRSLGDLAASYADLLITVGLRAKFIASEATTRGIERDGRVLPSEHVWSFDDAASAGQALDPLIQEGDLILITGSKDMQMERAVFEIMAEPLQAKELLVRQGEGR